MLPGRSIQDSSSSSPQAQTIRERFQVVLRVNDTSHRIALAFGIGVFIAFFPVMGVHTVMALAVAWVGRLSAPVILAGTLVNNPWTIAPIYGGSFWFGLCITGESLPSLRIDWSSLDMAALWGLLRPVLWPYCVGTILAGVLAGLISYGIVRYMVRTCRAGRTSQKVSIS